MINFFEKEFKNRLTTLINENFKNEQELVDLSQKLNVTRATINRWRNQSLTPKVEKLAQLASITRTSLDYIVFGKEQKNSSNLMFNEKEYKKRLSSLLSNNLKLTQIARQLNVQYETIRLWKKQESSPSTLFILKLAYIMNISLDNLLFGIEV